MFEQLKAQIEAQVKGEFKPLDLGKRPEVPEKKQINLLNPRGSRIITVCKCGDPYCRIMAPPYKQMRIEE